MGGLLDRISTAPQCPQQKSEFVGLAINNTAPGN